MGIIEKRGFPVRDIIGIPKDLVVNSYTLAFKAEDGPDNENTESEFAKFIEVAFCLIDVETGEEFYSEPITYSMN
jgi:hypothetical protein